MICVFFMWEDGAFGNPLLVPGWHHHPRSVLTPPKPYIIAGSQCAVQLLVLLALNHRLSVSISRPLLLLLLTSSLLFFFKVGELMAHAFEISRAVPAKVASQLASDARAWPTTGLGISALPKVSQR